MKLILKFIFLFVTIYLLVPYSIGLFGKIQQPGFKNLPTKDYIWIGVILAIMVALNVKWLYLDRRKRIT
jgi:hypothetical protein